MISFSFRGIIDYIILKVEKLKYLKEVFLSFSKDIYIYIKC